MPTSYEMLLNKIKLRLFLKKAQRNWKTLASTGYDYAPVQELIDCYADGYNPYETVIIIINERIKSSDSYDDITRVLSMFFLRHYVWDRPIIIEKWREQGLVRSTIYEQHNELITYTKKRWPDLFSKEGPKVEEWWEVHRTGSLTGCAIGKPESDDGPIKKFKYFTEATHYVEKTAGQRLWWYYGNPWGIRQESHPTWKAMSTPNKPSRIHVEMFDSVYDDELPYVQACTQVEFADSAIYWNRDTDRSLDDKPAVWYVAYNSKEFPIDNYKDTA